MSVCTVYSFHGYGKTTGSVCGFRISSNTFYKCPSPRSHLFPWWWISCSGVLRICEGEYRISDGSVQPSWGVHQLLSNQWTDFSYNQICVACIHCFAYQDCICRYMCVNQIFKLKLTCLCVQKKNLSKHICSVCVCMCCFFRCGKCVECQPLLRMFG